MTDPSDRARKRSLCERALDKLAPRRGSPGVRREPVSAVWLRRIGDRAQVLVEMGGVWRVVIEEHADGSYSHIAEARSFADRPVDPVTTNGGRE